MGARNGRGGCQTAQNGLGGPKKTENTCFLHFFGLFWDQTAQNGLGGPKKPKTSAFCIFFGLFWDILGPKMVWKAQKRPEIVWDAVCARARVHVCVHACPCVLVCGNGLEGLHVVWEALSGPSKYPEILRLGAVGLSCWRGDSALVFLDAACFIVLQCARASVPGETSRLLRTGARSFVAACLRACASGPQPRGQVWRAELTKAQGNGKGLVMEADDQASFVALSTNRFHIASDAPKVLGVKFISDLLHIRR